MYTAMREKDRKMHSLHGDQLFYKEIYLLEGGFSEFFEKFPEHCIGTYVTMKDE